MNYLCKSATWQKLAHHQQTMLKQQFKMGANCSQEFSLRTTQLFLDYSKNLITKETMRLLCELADEASLTTKIKQLFAGEKINITENRSVLHTALRDLDPKSHLLIDNIDITAIIADSLQKIGDCSERVRNGTWKGATGKEIRNVINIGIGGSDLGPSMVTEALKPYAANNLNLHFVSNIDSTAISEALKNLDPETTLFIVASKTFTTTETLTNASTARDWMFSHFSNTASRDTIIARHFIAVTANVKRACEFGVLETNIYPFWDFVGGRFSLWSAIGLAITIAIGIGNFRALLAGAHAMDEHFRTAPFPQNMPVILALLSIWYINFWGTTSQAILPYDQYLSLLPAYLQQLEMESNGKSVRLDGSMVDYSTAAVIWGSVGTNGQHAFHQLLMQGTKMIPADFIMPLKSPNPVGEHHLLLVANCFAQAQALMLGKSKEQVLEELLTQGLSKDEAEKLAPHKVIPGNRPSNMLVMEKVTPETLGALIALYEHRVFVEGVIWQINSFDQWSVELGKKISNTLVPVLQGKKDASQITDTSTQNLVKLYLAKK